jgi:hypothetical protein
VLTWRSLRNLVSSTYVTQLGLTIVMTVFIEADRERVYEQGLDIL